MKILLFQIRLWIETFEISHPQVAQVLSKIPASCPFAREIRLWGYTLQIPPLCHLNPVYDSLMLLRFRALTFLDETHPEKTAQI
ncbi:MAG: Mo-dependent nitrogenase C-terminal domain-containing protein [Microcoleaceae cyanobacterium]